ncbi:uncharacterized protein LOC126576715 [Anopheles aquasalis]|uniref:uncharacterized protein LOC126576715 n=1 Tax=Anopheles aquasalis TaxID=42839 RepID=UPI00215B05D5|nr:uncharacterized protein LOC126576715 [Anopheles aquasalis]
MQSTLLSRERLLKWFVVLLLYSAHANDVKPCSEQESVDITNGIIDADGSVEFSRVRYNSSQYFQDGNVRRGCICRVRQCIYICEAEELASVGVTELYANVSGASGESNRKINLAADDRFHLILREPHCEGYWLVLEQDLVSITSTGDLNLIDYIFNYSQFCMLPMNDMGEYHASYCQPEMSDLPHQIYAVGFLVSLPFLVATFVVYAILPELQNVGGKSLMCYVAALAISYLLLALARLDIYEYQSIMCRVTAYTLYFTLMASCFWLNVMSFDIYWTLGGSHGRTTERRKFLYYSLYAWGVPLLLLASNLLFDHTELISYHLRPNVGEEGCFLKEEKRTQFLYLYLPLLILISANIFFFAITAKRIYQSDQTEASTINDNSGQQSRREHERNRFGLYLRLFFMMGLTWSLELISWLMTDPKTASPTWVVYLLDACNCLAGIIIFFLFVWKQRVKNLLLQRFDRRERAARDDYTVYTCAQTTDIDTAKDTIQMVGECANPADASFLANDIATVLDVLHLRVDEGKVYYVFHFIIFNMPCILHSRVRLLKWFVVLLLYSAHADDAQLCSEQESVDITNGIIDADGSVEFSRVRYNSSQYFQDGNVRRGCICLVRQCIYICEAEELASVGVTELYANVSGASGESNRKINLAADDRFHLILREPHCEGYWLVLEQDLVSITSTGDLNLIDYIFNYSQFCMLPMNDMGEYHASYCQPEMSDLPHQIYAVGFLVSLPFLVATFVVYAILPELQNVGGKSLMCYVAALAISYLLLALGRLDIYDYQSLMCYNTAYALYFTLMAGFFWSNVMSFDIYWTLGRSQVKTTERRKFLYYSLYAWGTPLLLLWFVLLFDHTKLISYHLRPNVGEEGCFLKEEKLTQFLYLYLPLLLLISTNIFFYVVTAIRFSRSVQTKGLMMNNNAEHHSKHENDRIRFGLYLRLFFIMGVTWSLEIVSWLLTEPNAPHSSWVVYVLDASNCLVGIIIFFLFVCNQRVTKLLLLRFKFIRMENTTLDVSCVHTIAKSTYVLPIPCKSMINVMKSPEFV